MMRSRILVSISIVVGLLIVVFVVELLYIRLTGSSVPAPTIPRTSGPLGTGPELRYVVMGDSTSISQGSAYDQGYAVNSAIHLAQKYQVTLQNTGVSGATAETVRRDQLSEAKAFKPDIALIAVGANDATKFTRGDVIAENMQQIIDGLRQSNPAIKIIVTASPAMDSVSRFPFISKWVMNLRTKQVNAVFNRLISENDLTLAPIAQQTRQDFLDDPSLTAADKFHPNARGYALWTPVINRALDTALVQQ